MEKICELSDRCLGGGGGNVVGKCHGGKCLGKIVWAGGGRGMS